MAPLRVVWLLAGLFWVWGLFCPPEGLSLGWLGRSAPPAWVMGESQEYPSDKYMTGVGRGESREAAQDRAYAALALIFEADVQSRVREWEEYFQKTDPGSGPQVRRSVWIDQLTRVSTDRVLENVMIVEVWEDPKAQSTYALAVMDRLKSAGIIRERIEKLDADARLLFQSALNQSGRMEDDAAGRLGVVRSLYGAFKALLMREGLNRDLAIISPAGRGIQAPVSPARVGQMLRQALSTDFLVGLEVKGRHREKILSALREGLTREGLSVAQDDPEVERVSDILVRGGVSG